MGCNCQGGKTNIMVQPITQRSGPAGWYGAGPSQAGPYTEFVSGCPGCCSSSSMSSSSSSSGSLSISCKVLKTAGPPVCCDVDVPYTLILRRDVASAWSDNYGTSFNGYTTLTYNVASGHWQGSANLTATNQCTIFDPVADCTRTMQYAVRCANGACSPVLSAQLTYQPGAAPAGGCCGTGGGGALWWSSEIINCPTGPLGWTVVRFSEGYPWVDPSGSPGGNPTVVHTITTPTG